MSLIASTTASAEGMPQPYSLRRRRMGTSATATPAPPPAPARAAVRRLLRRPRGPAVDVLVALATALLALAAAAWVLRLWRGDMAVPFSYQFDALQHAMFVKGVSTTAGTSSTTASARRSARSFTTSPRTGTTSSC